MVKEVFDTQSKAFVATAWRGESGVVECGKFYPGYCTGITDLIYVCSEVTQMLSIFYPAICYRTVLQNLWRNI